MDSENLDELARQIAGGKNWKNPNDLMPKWPFRMIISGPSGSGKSNVAMNMIIKWLYFDQIIVCARDPEEDKYKLLTVAMQEVAEKRGKELDDVLKIITHPKDLPPLKDFSGETQTLVLFDDMVTLTEREQKPIEVYFVGARKKGCSMIYLTQNYFETPANVRKNSDYTIIFRLNSRNEIQQLAKDKGGGIDKDEFERIYRACTEKKYGFMLINSSANSFTERFRCGWDGFYTPTVNN